MQAQTIKAGTTQSDQAVAASAATVVSEELAYLSAVRPSAELVARVAGRPIDDSVLVAYGYGVCRRVTRTHETWAQIEQSSSQLGGGPDSDAARMALLVVRAARANICG